MKNRFRKEDGFNSGPVQPCPPAGNWVLHSSRCMCCLRMVDGKTSYTSTKTGRRYKIQRHYTCMTTYCVYLVTCGLCSAQYTGQTTKSMRDRHYGHRSEVKRKEEGHGEHFHQHAMELGISMEAAMEYFHLTIIGSVEPGQPWSKSRLDKLESDMMERLMTMQSHGGLNLRVERRRGGGQ